MSGLEQWWRDLPIVTKYLFALSFGLTLGANFGFFSFGTLILDWTALIQRFELWRLFTPFFFHGRLGFPFLIHMMFLLRYGQSLERDIFGGRTADYVFFLLFGGALLLVLASFVKTPILGMGLIMSIIYLWSRKHPPITMSFLFGIQFPSFYFPWALVAFNVLLGGFPLTELMGILVGHIYYFFEEIYPATSGIRLLKTPKFMYDLFPAPQNRYGIPPPGQVPRNQGRHNWGEGHVLGGN